MTRHRFLLEVLDEGVAFERWTEDGHTEACFDAADDLHRAVAAQAAGQALAEDSVATRALQDACPLCRTDLRDGVALVQDFTADAHGASAEKAPPTLSAALSAPIPEPVAATLRFGEVQQADRPPRSRLSTQPSADATAAHSPHGRLRIYAVAAVAVISVAIATLALVWQQQRTTRSKPAPGVEQRSPGASRTGPGTTTTSIPMSTEPSTVTSRAPSPGRAKVPAMHRVTPSLPAMVTPPVRVKPPAMRRTPWPPVPHPLPAMKRTPDPDLKDPRYGYLRINTIPWTRIWIDGRLRGSTPLLKLELRIGRHKLELKNRHHAIHFTTYINIRANKGTTIVKNFSQP